MQQTIAVAAERGARSTGAVVVKYDFKNAYNSVTRDAVRSGLEHGSRTAFVSHAVQLPDVGATLATGTTAHWRFDAANEACDVRAERSEEQGCPLSPALSAFAIAPALPRIATALRQLDPDALVLAYLDDLVIHVEARHAEEAARVVAS